MRLRQRSAAESWSVFTILRADAMRFLWRRGTSFGLDVVPEVCRSRATLSAVTAPAAFLRPRRGHVRVDRPGADSSVSHSSTGMPSLAAALAAEGAVVRDVISA